MEEEVAEEEEEVLEGVADAGPLVVLIAAHPLMGGTGTGVVEDVPISLLADD